MWVVPKNFQPIDILGGLLFKEIELKRIFVLYHAQTQ